MWKTHFSNKHLHQSSTVTALSEDDYNSCAANVCIRVALRWKTHYWEPKTKQETSTEEQFETVFFCKLYCLPSLLFLGNVYCCYFHYFFSLLEMFCPVLMSHFLKCHYNILLFFGFLLLLVLSLLHCLSCCSSFSFSVFMLHYLLHISEHLDTHVIIFLCTAYSFFFLYF